MIQMGPIQQEIYNFIEERYVESQTIIKQDEVVDVLLKAKLSG